MFTLYRIATAPARKLYKIGILFTHMSGDFGAISAVTERSFAGQIFNQIGVHTISDRFLCRRKKLSSIVWTQPKTCLRDRRQKLSRKGKKEKGGELGERKRDSLSVLHFFSTAPFPGFSFALAFQANKTLNQAHYILHQFRLFDGASLETYDSISILFPRSNNLDFTNGSGSNPG